MSIIFIAPAIISIVYNFVVITNVLVRNSIKLLSRPCYELILIWHIKFICHKQQYEYD